MSGKVKKIRTDKVLPAGVKDNIDIGDAFLPMRKDGFAYGLMKNAAAKLVKIHHLENFISSCWSIYVTGMGSASKAFQLTQPLKRKGELLERKQIF